MKYFHRTTQHFGQNFLFGFLAVGLFLGLPALTLAAPGDLDPTFSGDGKLTDWLSRGDEWGRGVAVQQDGKIVVAGYDSQNSDFSVVRYNPDGSLDPTFGVGGRVLTDLNSSEDMAQALTIQPDGKIVVAGSSYVPSDSYSSFAVVRYNLNGTLDTSFGSGGKVATNFGQNSSCYARSVVLQSDGKVVAAGYCLGSQPSGAALVRYNSDGSLDPTFGSDSRVLTPVNGSIRSVAIQADGKIVAAGSSVFRYNTDGSPDTSFDGDGMATPPTFDVNGINSVGYGYSVSIQADGKIVGVGVTGVNAGQRRFAFARFNPNGSLDTRLVVNINGWAEANSVAIQPDGKIVAAGYSSSPFPPYWPYSIAVVRLNANFSRDLTFGSNGVALTQIGPGQNVANSVTIQPDGKIVAAGTSDDSLNSDIAVIRHNSNGSLDTSFDTDGKVITDFGHPHSNVFSDTAIQPDGKIVASGTARYTSVLARYLPDGSPDTTFGSGTGKVTSWHYGSTGPVAIDPEGRIIAAGVIYDDFDQGHFTVFRYTADGSLDTTFGSGGSSRIVLNGGVALNDMLIQPDGKIVVAGSINGDFSIGRFNSNGSVDTSFDGDGIVITSIGSFTDDAKSVALQQDGRIVAAGYSRDSSFSYFTTVRYNTNGSLDTSFDGDGIVQTRMLSDDFAEDAAIQPDGKIVVAGCTTTAYDFPCDNFALARYNPNGSLDTTFDGDGRVITPFGFLPLNEAYLRSIAIQTDGKIVAAGYSGNGPTYDFTLVRYKSDGSLDGKFGGGDGKATADFGASHDRAYDMAVDTAGRAVLVGESNGRFAIARFLLAANKTSFDYDGDGRSDVSVFRTANSVWYLERSLEGFFAIQFGLSTDKLTPADYDGDGRTDISVFRGGVWYWLGSSNSNFNAVQFGISSDIPVPADYTGDGRAELAVYRGGVWYTLNLANNQFNAVQFGLSTDKPLPADYDGDGRADYAVYRNGVWYLLRSTQGFAAIQFGLATDKLVPADYDGDGKTDLAVYRDGVWYQLRSNQGFTAFQFGISTDIPAPADYDGDGRTDAAVYRDGTWYLQQSTNGFSAQQFGLTNDKPVPAVYLP